MLLPDFRASYVEWLHEFLWNEWSRIGVAGTESTSSSIVTDPEALLLFSLETCRTEPRLCDEILDWLVVNEQFINVQRLRNLSDRDPGFDASLLAGPAGLVARKKRSARWKGLAARVHEGPSRDFFLAPDGGSFPAGRELDPSYAEAGWRRPPARLRAHSRQAPVRDAPGLLFRLRAFLGLSARAELVAFLLTHTEAHPTELSTELGYSQPSMLQVCHDMETSGMLLSRSAGRERRFRLDHARWRKFLGFGARERLEWRNRPAEFRLLALLWRFLYREDWSTRSAYLQSSDLRRFCAELVPLAHSAGWSPAIEKLQDRSPEEVLGILASDIQTMLKPGKPSGRA